MIKKCSKCLLDTTIPNLKLNNNNICNHCISYNKISKTYPKGIKGEKIINKIIIEIKNKNKNKKYDCIIGISGGIDSSYLLYYTKKKGLNPLAIHYDNIWSSKIAKNNIKKLIKYLNVDLIIIKNNNKKMISYYKAFLNASVIDICSPCILGTTTAIFKTAIKYNIKYIFSGYSFRTEGLCPISIQYWDGLYFKEVIKRYSKTKAKNFGKINYGFKYMGFQMMSLLTKTKKIKTYKILNYINYNPQKAAKIMKRLFEYEYLKEPHFDCKYKAVVEEIHKKKFNFDLKKIILSGQIRSKIITKKEAIKKLNNENIKLKKKEINFCLKKLNLNTKEFKNIIKKKKQKRKNFKNLLWIIVIIKPILYILKKLNLFPKDTYFEFYN